MQKLRPISRLQNLHSRTWIHISVQPKENIEKGEYHSILDLELLGTLG